MRRPGTWLLVILALGILLASRFEKTEAYVYRRTSLRLSLNEDENEPLELTGRVLFKTIREDGAYLTVDAGRRMGRVRVSVKTEDLLSLPKTGQRVRIRGTPFLFQEAANPGQFSMRAYADAVGLSCQLQADRVESLSSFFSPLRESLFRIQYLQFRNIKVRAPSEDTAPLLVLLSGSGQETMFDAESPFTSGIPGLSYLFRFSAAHISFSGLFLYRFLNKHLKRERLSRCAALLFSFLLTLYAGFSVSALRAFLILLLRFSAMGLKRRFDLVSAGSWSLILLLLFRPSLLFTMAVYAYLPVLFGIGILAPELRTLLQGKHAKKAALVFPLSTAAAFLPLTLLSEHAYCPYAPLFSMLLYPLSRATYFLDFSGSLISGCFPPFGKAFLHAAGLLLTLSEILVKLCMRLPFSMIVTGCPGTGRVFVYYGTLAAITLIFTYLNHERKQERGRVCFLLLFAVFIFGLLFLRIPRVPEGETQIVMIDVGQGDGILIRTQKESFLIDGGSSDEDALMEYVLRPVLSYYGIRKLDGVFLSHGDADHLSGTVPLIASGFPVDRLYLPDLKEVAEEFAPALQAAEDAGIPVTYLSRGSSGRISTGSLSCLFPEEKSSRTGNASSMVLLYESGAFRALFTGDIGEEEEAMIDTDGPVDLLKAAHHGSRYSSSAGFLARTSPKLILISAGRNNPYGHPSEEALLRMQEAGSAFFSTSDTGQIVVNAEKDGTFRVCFPVLEKSRLR